MAKAAESKKGATINRELENIKDEIQAMDAESAVNARKAERLRNYFGELQRLDSERRQALERYSAALKNSEKELKEFQKFYDTTNTMVLAELKRKKGEIDRKIDEFDAEVEKQEKELDVLVRKAETDKREWEAAKQKHDVQLKKYSELLSEPLTPESLVKDLTKLKEQIGKEDNVARKYFLNLEIRKTLEGTKIKTLNGLSAELDKAWRALRSAKDDMDAAEDACNESNAGVKAHQTRIETLKRNRPAEILSRL